MAARMPIPSIIVLSSRICLGELLAPQAISSTTEVREVPRPTIVERMERAASKGALRDVGITMNPDNSSATHPAAAANAGLLVPVAPRHHPAHLALGFALGDAGPLVVAGLALAQA